MAQQQQIDRNLTEELGAMLRDEKTPQSVVNDVLASIALTQSRDMDSLIAASQRQEKKLDDIIGRLKIMDAKTSAMNDVPARLSKIEHYISDNPSLVWLMRYKTRQTITIIVLAFVLLSIFYVSGFRQPMLKFLGLPVF